MNAIHDEGKISIVSHPNNPVRLYGINHFLGKFGIQRGEEKESMICINYGGNSAFSGFGIDIIENRIQNNVCGAIMSNSFDYEIPLLEIATKTEGEALVVFTRNDESYPCISLKENSITIGFDIFNEAGHILTGHLDSMIENQELIRIPIVDCYEKILFDCLLLAYHKLGIKPKFKPFWPDNKKFALCLTHDVDRVYKTYQYFTHFVKRTVKDKYHPLLNQSKSVFEKLKGHEPYWMFERIMEMETRFNVKSTFFFLNENSQLKPLDFESWKLFSGRYSIVDSKIIDIMKKLRHGGWEIGVHGSYNSYSNCERIKEEKKVLENLLNEEISGIRQHYGNLTTPDTWVFQEAAGFKYDTSLCVKNDVGFRWGTCFPFYPFNTKTKNKLSLLEIPLIIMDGALFKNENPLDECERIVDIVEHYGGILTVLWHPHVFSENDYPGWGSIYEKLIALCKERGAYIATAGEIEQWWNSR